MKTVIFFFIWFQTRIKDSDCAHYSLHKYCVEKKCTLHQQDLLSHGNHDSRCTLFVLMLRTDEVWSSSHPVTR